MFSTNFKHFKLNLRFLIFHYIPFTKTFTLSQSFRKLSMFTAYQTLLNQFFFSYIDNSDRVTYKSLINTTLRKK